MYVRVVFPELVNKNIPKQINTYDRLVKYMQILRNNRFILFVGRDRVKA